GRQVRIHQNRQLGLAEHVDEARSYHHTAGVYGALGRRVRQIANHGNLTVANADVTRIPGRAGAVNNVAVANDNVVGWVLGLRLLRPEFWNKKQKQQSSELSGHVPLVSVF